LTIQQSDIDSGSGNLYQTVKPGDSVSVDELLRQMIVYSDNTAQDVFLRQMQQSDFDNFEKEVGLEDLFDNKGYISAKEYSHILRVLWTSSYLERENSEKILQFMADATVDFIQRGLPNGVIFADKYGENKLFSIFADSGIVYANGKPYMITVILKGKDSTEASRQWAVDLMKQISEHAYQAGLSGD
jgi:beta-lactamase class A